MRGHDLGTRTNHFFFRRLRGELARAGRGRGFDNPETPSKSGLLLRFPVTRKRRNVKQKQKSERERRKKIL
jgi:hypothetical protein